MASQEPFHIPSFRSVEMPGDVFEIRWGGEDKPGRLSPQNPPPSAEIGAGAESQDMKALPARVTISKNKNGSNPTCKVWVQPTARLPILPTANSSQMPSPQTSCQSQDEMVFVARWRTWSCWTPFPMHHLLSDLMLPPAAWDAEREQCSLDGAKAPPTKDEATGSIGAEHEAYWHSAGAPAFPAWAQSLPCQEGGALRTPN